MIFSRASTFCTLALCYFTGPSLAGGVQNTDTTIEFDLVFPRNETYAPPTDPFSIVFALRDRQNITQGFKPELQWNLVKAIPDSFNKPYKSGSLFPKLDSDNTTVYSWKLIDDYVKGEGQWIVNWQIVGSNCTSITTKGIYTTNLTSIFFTTKNGAPKADIAPSKCSDMTGVAIYVTGSQASCASLPPEEPMITPDVCAVNPNKAQVASISSSMTAVACRYPSPTISCPPLDKDSGVHSIRLSSTSSQLLLLAVLCISISFLSSVL